MPLIGPILLKEVVFLGPWSDVYTPAVDAMTGSVPVRWVKPSASGDFVDRISAQTKVY